MRNVVLLRVGIDAGCGGIQGPLFKDGSFDFVCIPDNKGVNVHTYGNLVGSSGTAHVSYFPESRRSVMTEQHVHVDPEWETFTYGDPTPPKRSLRNLKPGDFLVFYCGLQEWDAENGWNRDHRPGLYLAGYFEVALAGMAGDFEKRVLATEFGKNFHVRYPAVVKKQTVQLRKQSDLAEVAGLPWCSIATLKSNGGKLHRVVGPAIRQPDQWVLPVLYSDCVPATSLTAHETEAKKLRRGFGLEPALS